MEYRSNTVLGLAWISIIMGVCICSLNLLALFGWFLTLLEGNYGEALIGIGALAMFTMFGMGLTILGKQLREHELELPKK